MGSAERSPSSTGREYSMSGSQPNGVWKKHALLSTGGKYPIGVAGVVHKKNHLPLYYGQKLFHELKRGGVNRPWLAGKGEKLGLILNRYSKTLKVMGRWRAELREKPIYRDDATSATKCNWIRRARRVVAVEYLGGAPFHLLAENIQLGGHSDGRRGPSKKTMSLYTYVQNIQLSGSSGDGNGSGLL